MARAMLCEYEIPKFLWAEAINTGCYVLNRTLIRKFLKKTPYELWKGHPPNLSYFHVFGCKCFILNIKENLGKFDPKTHEGIFLGYSTNSKAYRVYNKNSKTVEETMHVTFCETNIVPSVCIDDSPGFEAELPENNEPVQQNSSSQEDAPASNENSNSAEDNLELSSIAAENTDADAIVDQEEPESSNQSRRPREWRFLKNYPEKFIIENPSTGRTTRSSLKRAESNNIALLSKTEPQNIQEALADPSWVLAMKEELQQFEKNQVWSLVPYPNGKKVIGTK
ncbi:uncharacterized protein [Arachis hypogaea]|uniref:uncharacterized protein n=1 Tax=Arachis hypogaea TaxID=3818 RepID=UPI003B21F25C